MSTLVDEYERYTRGLSSRIVHLWMSRSDWHVLPAHYMFILHCNKFTVNFCKILALRNLITSTYVLSTIYCDVTYICAWYRNVFCCFKFSQNFNCCCFMSLWTLFFGHSLEYHHHHHVVLVARISLTLSPLLPIVHRPRQVFRTTSLILT